MPLGATGWHGRACGPGASRRRDETPGAGRARTVSRNGDERAALVALMLRGIAEHYRYYGFLPRLQQVTICLCVLCLVGAALERVGARK